MVMGSAIAALTSTGCLLGWDYARERFHVKEARRTVEFPPGGG